jgi:Reverse transcriptase (RNA-dependent DNA polymerase)
VPRTAGTPQGGVISPLLANLFLHYAFDMWMARTSPHIPFERYADDNISKAGSTTTATSIGRSCARPSRGSMPMSSAGPSVTVRAPRRRGSYGARLLIALRPASWCCIRRRRRSSTVRMQTGVAISPTNRSTFSGSHSEQGRRYGRVSAFRRCEPASAAVHGTNMPPRRCAAERLWCVACHWT